MAPTGTISLLADNISSGLEPVFSFTYTRRILQPDGSRREEEVSDYAYRLFRRLKGPDAPLTRGLRRCPDPGAGGPCGDAGRGAALYRQLGLQDHQLPADISFEAFKDVYGQAYELGCKGCTTYRPNAITGAVLEPLVHAPAAPRKPG